MIGALVVVVYAALGLLAAYGFATTVADRPPGRTTRLAVGVVVALLVGQAVLAAIPVLGGNVTLPEQTTFLIYLVVSVCVLPIALQFATAEPTRWGGTVVAVGAIAVAVAVWRVQLLWDAGNPGG